jgi:Ca-activated chloride channel family protein
MKEIFDRHQEKLTPAERHAIWRKISGSPARESRTRLRWGLSASTAVLAAAVITFAVLHREPAAPPQLIQQITDATPLGTGRTSTDANRVDPKAGPDRVAPVTGKLLSEPRPASRETPKDRDVASSNEIEVTAKKLVDTKTSTTKQQVSGEAVRLKAGVVAQGGELHYRGGRAGEVRYQLQAAPQAAKSRAAPPVIPITGGTALPNDEPYDAMYFRNFGVNPFIATEEDSLSTFAVDVDAASYTITRRYIELGNLPPADAVRVEEFVNFFPQGYPRFENDDFRILIDGAPSPFGRGYHLLRIGLKGREISPRDRKSAQLTFVIDVSGSMGREDRLELVKRIDRLHPEGSTNAEEGLLLGYEMARRGFRPEMINRIVLCSDGVANVGRTGPKSILERVRTEADRGIRLSTIGFGMGNYNDVLMEQLANKADGNYYYVDNLGEARRVFVENLTGTLQTIAKDAKIQVEFNPSQVLRYRLLGFENRDVADRDFRNDKVDAGEIGAGHEVTALYEVKLAPQAAGEPIATVRLRYARPEHDGGGAPEVREIATEFSLAGLSREFEDASPRFRLDAAVAEFAEILRGSYWARESRLVDVLPVARSAARDLREDEAAEFVVLVEKAARLSSTSGPEESTEEP